MEHGIREALFNNLAEGWQITCLCGWTSTPNARMEDTGAEFDEHLTDFGQGPRPVMSHR